MTLGATNPGPPREAACTILVAAAILVEERVEGPRVLVTQRKAGRHLAGAWEFPGGKVLPGEDPREALRRELREELGIEAIAGEIVDATFHRYADASSAVLLLFFEAARSPGSAEPIALDVAAFEWAQPDQLDPSRFPPADVSVLRKVKAMIERCAIRESRLGIR
jgi:8-oxo-dGTP diphosphatase